METSLWNDSFLMDGDWGLDLPFHQENGLFGDLKSEGHVGGTDTSSFQPQDSAEASFSSEISNDDGSLGLDWMESSDFSRYLNQLDGFDSKLEVEPLFSSIQEPLHLITDQPAVENQLNLKSFTGLKTFGQAVSSAESTVDEIGFDALLSAPESPEQVIPVIKFEVNTKTEASPALFISEDGIFDELQFSHVTDLGDTSLCLDSGVDLINSPLSADDVDSLFSASEPTSPSSINSQDESISIIKASPELYKIISTSSLGVSKRVSPYPKSKLKKEPRSLPQRRTPAQPVPEHVILEQVNKKDRKKLQNKNAAIRYRQKKKDEAMGIKSEEQILEEHNTSLKTKVEDLEREIKYMKGLMHDIYKAKGLIA
ncbi:cyclic AMP-dependent transcription factor ATF-4-like [Elysia marginata]|uniref:Cyclic AMP-dependent transcription factor ATF-4-like n=1 Tax=Elysia marginata TaxID=1093978 RepID=A0AAV4GWT4_9GAST|nr:cyclic AMP-dependent transcription factor ATF-4-like [Elysia marginata]